MTGGDPITARFMRGDFFTYQPQFKPVIAGNHRPGFRNPDEAIRRRLHLVPFVQTFATPDRDLSARLKAEAGGILRWAIEGCQQWQAHGLSAPESVRAATSDYLEEQDVVREWLEECTEPSPGSFTANPDLWASWQQWANARGIFTRSKTWVTAGLARHGYESAKMRQHGGQHRGVIGLRLTTREDSPDLLGHLRQGGDISTSHARARIPAHAHTRAQTERQYAEGVSQVSHPASAKVLVTWRGGDQVVLDAHDRDLTLMREHIAKVEPYVEAA
jgi:phage/plasmid-associated DNA primase